MTLYESEITDIRNGDFFLDASEITLIRQNNSDDVYRGPGFVRQAQEGRLEYRLYDCRRETSFPSTFSLSAGGVIPDDHYYDLRLLDHNGRNWEATRTLPTTSGVLGRNECVCKGEVFEITCVEDFGYQDELWMFLPGVFRIPTNAGTSTIETVLTEERLRFDPNIWKVTGARFEIVTTRAEDGIEFRVRPIGESLPVNLSKCLEEATWFVLSVPAYAQIINRISNGVTRFTIRQPKAIPVNPRLRPPLEPTHGDTAEALGDLLLRYLEYVLPKIDDAYHATSVNVLSVLRAAAITIESLALALSIAIESIVRREFAEFGLPDQRTMNALDSAMDYLSGWATDEPMKHRVTQAIQSWKGSSARDALKYLAEKGVIAKEQLIAWNSIRHPMVHGQGTNRATNELLHLCDVQHMALLRLLFQVLGYNGPYTDRSMPGWTRTEFTCANLGGKTDTRIASV